MSIIEKAANKLGAVSDAKNETQPVPNSAESLIEGALSKQRGAPTETLVAVPMVIAVKTAV